MKYSMIVAAGLVASAAASPFGLFERSKTTKKCTPVSLLTQFLDHRVTLEILKTIIAPKATYVSLNYVSDQFKELVPWSGTHFEGGPQEIWDSFTGAAALWVEPEFAAWNIFGDHVNAAAFGNLTYISKYSGMTAKSLFSIFANVSDCQIQYLTFQTDDFLLSTAWEVEGAMVYHPGPVSGNTPNIVLPPVGTPQGAAANPPVDPPAPAATA